MRNILKSDLRDKKESKKKVEKKMNINKNYKKGTRAEIIKIMYMCGVVPERSLKYLDAKNYKTMRMKISEMIKEGTLRYCKREKLTRALILEDNPKERTNYEKVLPESLLAYNEHYVKTDVKRFMRTNKSEGSKNKEEHINDSNANRVFYNNDTLLFMYGIGIKTLAKHEEEIFDAVYLTSREIKNDIGYKAEVKKTDGGTKINYSRLRGLLLTSKYNYAIYRSGNRSTYKQNGEYKMKLYLDRLMVQRFNRATQVDEAILIIDEKRTDIEKEILVPRERETKFSFTGMEFVYKKIYCLPANKNGQRLMKAFTQPDWNEKMVKGFGLPTVPGMEGGLCDGFDGEKYYYVYCIPDIKRFKKFVARARITAQRSNYVVICFDWQVELVKKVIGAYAVIKKVPFERYMKEMGF